MLPPFIRKYTQYAIAGAPDVLENLLIHLPLEDAVWDHRPDAERFTLREIAAHLADWEDIFHERILHICREDDPDLPNVNEGHLAVENDYANSNPQDCMARFRVKRARLMNTLGELSPDEWERKGHYITASNMVIPNISVEDWMVQVSGHDGYHLCQIAQWLAIERPR